MNYFHFLPVSFYLFFAAVSVSLAQKDTINITDSKGLKQGKWSVNYENGKKRYEGNFKDNNPTGAFIYFYESGEKNAEMIFTENGKKSKAKYFHLNGMLMGKGNYSGQKKDSTWLYYDDREILSKEENYREGKMEGISKVFYLDGSIAEEKNWRNNVEHGSYKQFFQGGKLKYEANYADGNPDGKVNYYHPNGQIRSTGIHQFAVKNGDWISYNEDGSVYTIECYNMGNLTLLKKMNGIFTAQYPSGNPMEEFPYKDGMKNGIFKEYFDKPMEPREPKDTTKKAMEEWETLYSDVKLFDDQHVTESPKIKTQGNYLNDKLEGEVTHYHISGAIEKVENYKDGKLINKK